VGVREWVGRRGRRPLVLVRCERRPHRRESHVHNFDGLQTTVLFDYSLEDIATFVVKNKISKAIHTHRIRRFDIMRARCTRESWRSRFRTTSLHLSDAAGSAPARPDRACTGGGAAPGTAHRGVRRDRASMGIDLRASCPGSRPFRSTSPRMERRRYATAAGRRSAHRTARESDPPGMERAETAARRSGPAAQ